MRALALVAALALTGCAGGIVPRTAPLPPIRHAPVVKPKPAVPLSGPRAATEGLTAGPAVDVAGVAPERLAHALAAFRASCPALLRRTDTSGLTQNADWTGVCTDAAGTSDAGAGQFFSSRFDAVQVGTGDAYATGYYEPEISGSRTVSAGYPVPIYGRPPELISIDLGAFSDALKGKKISGRVAGTALVPFYERSEIVGGALAGRGLEIAWAADPVEFFFLQVQGSGRLRLPDGSVMRIGYADQNGRDYVGIGALMRQRGLLQPGQLSMQGVMAWLRAHPDEGVALMNENKSFVFFRELTGDGPVGALGIAVTPRATVAADPAYVPLGAPVLLALDRPETAGIWVAQDTGGAIKGANRFDTFWGAGDEARVIAGGMSARGKAWVLLPKDRAAPVQPFGSQAPRGTPPRP